MPVESTEWVHVDGTTEYYCPRCLSQGNIEKVNLRGKRVGIRQTSNYYYCLHCEKRWDKKDADTIYSVSVGISKLKAESYSEGYNQGYEHGMDDTNILRDNEHYEQYAEEFNSGIFTDGG